MTKRRTITLYAIVVVAACVVVLLPLAALVPFARPSADDFSYSLLTHAAFVDTGGSVPAVLAAAIQTSADFYNTWQGLYTSAFVLSLQPGIAGAAAYPWGVALMLASIIVPCLYFAYVVERRLLELGSNYWVAAGVVAAIYVLQCMPALNQALYWYNGAANYTPWVFACLFTAGLSATALKERRAGRRVRAILLASLLAIVMGGTNYMPAFLNIMLLFGFACLGFAKRGAREGWVHVLPLAFAVCGFALSAMAPGTAIRQSFFPDHPGVASTVAHSLWQALQDIHAFADLSLLATFVAITPFLVVWAKHTPVGGWSLRTLGLALVAGYVLMVGLLCVPYYSMGTFGENRTYAPVFDLFAVGSLFLYGYFVCWAASNGQVRAALGRLADRMGRALPCAVGACCIVAVALFGSVTAGHGNGFTAVKHLVSGEAAAFVAEYDARDLMLSQMTGQRASVPALETRPELLFFSDIEAQEEDWSGVIAQYYGLTGVEESSS